MSRDRFGDVDGNRGIADSLTPRRLTRPTRGWGLLENTPPTSRRPTATEHHPAARPGGHAAAGIPRPAAVAHA